jgi:TadE-like protein
MGRVRLAVASDRERGQGLVEFAIILPVFMLVVFGLFDVGRLVYTNSALSQAAREGARVAAAEAGWITVPGAACVSDESYITAARPGAHVCPADVTAFKSHIRSAVNRMTVLLGPVSDVYISCNDGDVADPLPTGAWTEASGGNGCQDGSGNAISSQGTYVSVRVEYEYETFTPLISSFVGSVPLTANATMIIN